MSWISRRKQEPDLVVEVQPAPLINRERLTPYVDGARVAVDTARERVTPYVGTARERVTPYVETAVERVTPYVDTARDKVTPYAEHARDWASHGVEDARLRAVPVVTGAVDKYVPRIEHAIDEASSKLVTVLESAGPARTEVQRRGSAAVAALKGEVAVPDKKGGRWGRRFLVVSLLTGLGAAAFAFFRRQRDEDAWITSDAPYPTYGGTPGSTTSPGDSPVVAATTPAVAAEVPPVDPSAGMGVEDTALVGDGALGGLGSVGEEPIELAGDESDLGGAAADEAVADAAYEPGEPSTPDEPTERVTPKDVAEHIHPRDV